MMRRLKMFSRKPVVPAEFLTQDEIEKARRRVSRMTTSEALNWADVAGSGMHGAFRSYRDDPDNSLEDIRMGLVGMLAIYEELLSRNERY